MLVERCVLLFECRVMPLWVINDIVIKKSNFYHFKNYGKLSAEEEDYEIKRN